MYSVFMNKLKEHAREQVCKYKILSENKSCIIDAIYLEKVMTNTTKSFHFIEFEIQFREEILLVACAE